MNSTSQPSVRQKEVARITATSFGIERPPIALFHDDARSSAVCILEARNRPEINLTSYGTIGLADHALIRNGADYGIGVEILGIAKSEYAYFPNILATLAFCVINSKWFCAPGIVFPDAVSMHDESSKMSDIYFTYPFPWSGKFLSTRVVDRTVTWLLAIPISKSETEYLNRYGPQALEKVFDESKINVFDLNREPIV